MVDRWTPGHHKTSLSWWSKQCEMRKASSSSCIGHQTAELPPTRPHAKHPQCSKPNWECEKIRHLTTRVKPKTKKATEPQGFFFSCLLNHVKNGQAQTSCPDGRTVGWGGQWEALKNQTPNQSQNQLQDTSVAIWSLVPYHQFSDWWIIYRSNSTKWSWRGFWIVQTMWWVTWLSPYVVRNRASPFTPKLLAGIRNTPPFCNYRCFSLHLFIESFELKFCLVDILRELHIYMRNYIHIYICICPGPPSPLLHPVTSLLEGGKTSTSVYHRGLSYLFFSSPEHLGDLFWPIFQQLTATCRTRREPKLCWDDIPAYTWRVTPLRLTGMCVKFFW